MEKTLLTSQIRVVFIIKGIRGCDINRGQIIIAAATGGWTLRLKTGCERCLNVGIVVDARPERHTPRLPNRVTT